MGREPRRTYLPEPRGVTEDGPGRDYGTEKGEVHPRPRGTAVNWTGLCT